MSKRLLQLGLAWSAAVLLSLPAITWAKGGKQGGGHGGGKPAAKAQGGGKQHGVGGGGGGGKGGGRPAGGGRSAGGNSAPRISGGGHGGGGRAPGGQAPAIHAFGGNKSAKPQGPAHAPGGRVGGGHKFNGPPSGVANLRGAHPGGNHPQGIAGGVQRGIVRGGNSSGPQLGGGLNGGGNLRSLAPPPTASFFGRHGSSVPSGIVNRGGGTGAPASGPLFGNHAGGSNRNNVARSGNAGGLGGGFAARHGSGLGRGALPQNGFAALGPAVAGRHQPGRAGFGSGGQFAVGGNGRGNSFASRHAVHRPDGSFRGGQRGGGGQFRTGFANRNSSQVVNNFSNNVSNNFSNFSSFNNFGGGRRGGWGGGSGWGGWSTPFLYGYGWGSPYYRSGWGGFLGAALYGLSGFGYGGSNYNGWGYGGFGAYCGSANGYYAYSPVGYVDYGAYAVSDVYAPDYYTTLSPPTTVVGVMPETPVLEQPAIVPVQTNEPADDATSFTEKGEAAFKAGDYQGAVYAWRHAVVDDPQNGIVVMMLGQALFATGKFDEAAGATQAAMQVLPKDQWGVVIGNHREIYGDIPDYTNQLRALEREVKDKSDKPALRFLLGFHYAYLGYPREAIDQLEKGLKLAPRDEAARQLRDETRAKLARPVTESAASPSPDPS